MKIPAKIFKMHAKTYERGSSKIFAENREDLGQNFWNIEKEKCRKRESRRQASETQREKEPHRARARDKKRKGTLFFYWKHDMKIL